MKQGVLACVVAIGAVVHAQPTANIGINEPQRKQIANKLNVILADEYVLLTKLLNYHWNVTGMAFGPLHDLFQKQYEQVFALIDGIAERVRALDARPIGTLKSFLEYTNLEEHPGRYPEAQAMISQLVTDYHTIIRHMRQEAAKIDEIGDIVTSNFLEEVITKHEKGAWMLRAHLAEKSL